LLLSKQLSKELFMSQKPRKIFHLQALFVFASSELLPKSFELVIWKVSKTIVLDFDTNYGIS